MLQSTTHRSDRRWHCRAFHLGSQGCWVACQYFNQLLVEWIESSTIEHFIWYDRARSSTSILLSTPYWPLKGSAIEHSIWEDRALEKHASMLVTPHQPDRTRNYWAFHLEWRGCKAARWYFGPLLIGQIEGGVIEHSIYQEGAVKQLIDILIDPYWLDKRWHYWAFHLGRWGYGAACRCFDQLVILIKGGTIKHSIWEDEAMQ